MRSRRWSLAAHLLTVLLATAVTLPYTFGGDIRYEIGAKAVSSHDAAGTFTHRPLLYRLLSTVITAPAERLTDTVVGLEVVLRISCAVLVGGAVGVLWLGLRRRVPADATPVAVTTFVALVLIGPRITLEPEWLAVVLTVAGVGAALAVPDRRLGAVLGGVLLAAAAATKILTLPIALIGVLATGLLDRGRALPTTIAAAVSGTGYVVAMTVLVPQEVVWLLDLGSVQPTAPPLATAVSSTAELLGNAATLWPAFALLPAALVEAPRRWLLAGLVGVALAWLPAQIQGQYFPYHLSALPVVAAVVLVLALRRGGIGFTAVAAGYAGWAAWVISSPPEWREENVALVFTLTALVAVSALVVRLGQHRSARRQPVPARAAQDPDVPLGTGDGVGVPAGTDRQGTGPVAGVVAVALLCLAASTPTSYSSISLAGTERYNPTQQRGVTQAIEDTATKVRDHVGAGSEVTYLTFGDFAYFLGNPTSCRYPSPVFLQRGQPREGEPPTRSWQQALQCITEDPGEWLVRDTDWFSMSRQPPAVVDALDRAFACEDGVEISEMMVCPRRTAG